MSENIIKINRGDSFAFSIRIPSAENFNENYILNTADSIDVVYFALLYPHQRFDEAFLIKGFTIEDQNMETGEISIQITPNDTRTLLPGVYYYTVKLQRGGTLEVIDDLDDAIEVRTIVERTKFIINE